MITIIKWTLATVLAVAALSLFKVPTDLPIWRVALGGFCIAGAFACINL